METRIAISALLDQIQVGLLEDGRLAEFYIQRSDQQRAVGNIYKGKVENVLPGMDAAFIDIGGGKNGFLHVSALPVPPEKQDLPIERLLRKGQSIVVQVEKEQVGSKGLNSQRRSPYLDGSWFCFLMKII